ncbi:MAG: membrane protein insertion efficiency factor YidD [Thermoanaerobaculaceae bacterium]|nr:membrane protein insertion efficiency factor YidD [Thermoanaerobaculaceae bacterium]
MKFVILSLIKFYKVALSPILPPSCRFYPTCSEYAYQAISVFGVFKGSILAIKRILRCHPFCDGGYDPIPQKDVK